MSPKLKPELDPSHLTAHVIMDSVRQAIVLARKQEQGIIDDSDTEFLHAYRIIIRTTRVILGRIKEVFRPDIEQQLIAGFAELGNRTNRLRDLDVYLSKEEAYKKMVPDNLADSLTAMFDDFRVQRNEEAQSLHNYLQSQDYLDLINQLESLADYTRNSHLSATGRTPIAEIATLQVKSQLKRVIKMEKHLRRDSTDRTIHKLRLQCKKLRYLLEYFSSLFDNKLLRRALKAMRHLQNTLGDYNDLSVQQRSLSEYHAISNKNNPEFSLAIGALIGCMRERQIALRERIAILFDNFQSKETQHTFRKLIKSIQQ
jgi:CHAD domain-containing protein